MSGDIRPAPAVGAQGSINFIAQSGPSLEAAEFGVTTGASHFAVSGTAFYSLTGTINQGGSQ